MAFSVLILSTIGFLGHAGAGGGGGEGGNGQGGGLYSSNDMVSLIDATFDANTATGGTGGAGGTRLAAHHGRFFGGDGGRGGNGQGGGLYTSNDMVTLTDATFDANTATGGTGDSGFSAARRAARLLRR